MRLKQIEGHHFCSRCEKKFERFEPTILVCADGIGVDICENCSTQDDRIIGTSIFLEPESIQTDNQTFMPIKAKSNDWDTIFGETKQGQ